MLNSIALCGPRVVWLALLCAVCLWCAAVVMPVSAMQKPRPRSPAPRKQPRAEATKPETDAPATRPHYHINIKLDFDGRSYTGTERVAWVNSADRPTSVIYFHLYPNLRPDGGGGRDSVSNSSGTNSASEASAASLIDEPRLEVMEVRTAATAQPLPFSIEDQGVTLRVQARESIAAGASAELEIKFKGTVPEIGADETSLPAHVVQQVGAALRDTRETRRTRDTNFSSRGIMLLGSAYPVLAVRDNDDWQRKAELTVGDVIYTEVADYRVTIEAPDDLALFTSAEEVMAAGGKRIGAREFAGDNLRSFALVAGRTLRSAERAVAGVNVRSVFAADHENIGRRVLGVAAEAVRVYVARFGALPLKTICVTEAPLVAGLGSAEFAGLGVIASAYYVDFDAPSMRNLPEIVREQRASVEDSLEFTVAQVVAHHWWGAIVGGDPERAPVLDEALSHWSALLYYTEVHGEARAAQALDDQLRGVYQVYRTFGGEDMAADRAARDYRNSFQYAAIVAGKGALMFVALRRQMGDERFWTSLRRYYEANRFEVAKLDDLRAAFAAEVPVAERRAVTRTFNRWLTEKRGDEDIAPPNPQLAAALGLPTEPNVTKDRNAFSRLGRFFWRQMTRIR
ncbi:MAG: hypothetical protein M3458_10755 [Acidobacteriota bacterium]|nr:hypothetical protein [Acidobacteriota bacterium]